MLSCVGIFAQDAKLTRKLDSLSSVIKKSKNDTVKVNTYSALCYFNTAISPGKAMKYADTINNLSKKINYVKGVALYNFHKASLVVYSNPKEAIILAKKAKSFFSKTNDEKYYFYALLSLIYAYYNNQEMSNVIKEAEGNLKKAEKYKDKFVIATLHNYEGSAYQYLQQYHKALFHFRQAVIINKKAGTSDFNYPIYQNIAVIYNDLSQFNDALRYINLALKLNFIDFNEHVLCLDKIEILNNMNLPNVALQLALENAKFFKQNNAPLPYQLNLLKLSKSYYKNKNFQMAIDCLKEMESEQYNNTIAAEVFLNIGNGYKMLGKKEKTRYYIDKAFSFIDSVETTPITLDLYLAKYNLEKDLGNYQKAVLLQEKYINIADKYNATINKEKLLELQTEFDVTEKENKIKTMQVSALQKNSQIEKQRRYLVYGGIGLVLALLGIVVFIKVYRTIKNKNKIINYNNKALQSSIIEKEILLKEIHHRVKNNLQLVMSLLNIQSKEVGNTMDDFLKVSQSRIISMSLIHESLYQTENLSKVDFKEYIIKLTDAIVNSQNSKQQDIHLKVEVEDIYFDIQTAIPLGLIINELVNNAYKHAFKQKKQGIIALKLHQTKDSFILVISDNGTGNSEVLSLKKTLGMELVKLLVLQIKGVLQIQNNMGISYNIQFKNQTI